MTPGGKRRVSERRKPVGVKCRQYVVHFFEFVSSLPMNVVVEVRLEQRKTEFA